MRRVLITGGTGFIGRHCLAPLAACGAEVHAVVRSPGRTLPRGVHAHAADLLNPVQAEALIAEVRPTHLLHLAWITTPGTYWTSPENLHWVEASLRLLRKFAEHGGQRVVMTGSCAEYDWLSGHCHEGRTPLRPATLYGACKDALRALLEAFAIQAGLSAAWGRVFFLYGPHEHPRRLVSSVARALLAGEPVSCSAGTQRRDFLHVADAADALVALLHSDVRGAVNIASGEAVAVREVAQRVAAAAGRPDLLQLGALPMSPGDPPELTADVTRLREEVRWAPRFRLEQGLAQTVAWWKTQAATGHAAPGIAC